MSDQRAGDGREGKDDDKDATVAKTAGFVVFSGIAMSILKALNPYNKPNLCNTTNNEAKPIIEPTEVAQQSHSLSAQEPIIKKPITCVEQIVPESSSRTIEIIKGDTLWGLSTKYGVSIESIKEANGLEGDTIYAGKKLIIP